MDPAMVFLRSITGRWFLTRLIKMHTHLFAAVVFTVLASVLDDVISGHVTIVV